MSKAFVWRRAAALFVVAGIAATLALTSGRWLPEVPRLLGFAQANREAIGILADVFQVLDIVVRWLLWGATALLVYLGFKKLGTAEGSGRTSAADVAPGGRGVAISGDVDQSVIIAGDVTYDHSVVSSSPADPGELEEAQRRLDDLPLGDVPERGTVPQGSVVRLRPNPHFVGRHEDLKDIAENLKAGGTAAIGEVAVAASSGLGGVGKTQLACEFVYRYGRYFHGVYWLSFAEPGGVPAQVASCGGAGGMDLRPDFHLLPFEERVRAVMSEWQSGFPRLLVFDNCEEEELLDRWLPPSGGCRVLITSRRSSWDGALGVTELSLGVLNRQESVALLREHRPDVPEDSPELDAIAEELGNLPLALDLAGRYLAKYHREVTPAEYLKNIQQPEILEHPSLRRAKGVSPTKHAMDVWRTFAVSYRRLDADDETDQTTARLLARAARLAAGEAIPDYLLAWTLEPPERDGAPPEPSTAVRDALERLAGLGLLERSGEAATRMHRLVAAFALAEAPDDEARVAVEAACSRAAKRASRQGQPARQEALLPHLRHVTDSAKERVDGMAANCCTALGMTLGDLLGANDEGLPYIERAWEISVELYGPEDRHTLQRRSDMAKLLEGRRDRARARAIYEEVLEAQERRYGHDDPDVAATLNNLGASYAREDLYHKTLPLYRRALRIREGVWERTEQNDPDRRENAYEAAEGNGNMGALMMDLARYREAMSCLERALHIMSDEFGMNHKRNAENLTIIGSALRATGDYPQAVTTLMAALNVFMHVSQTPPPAAAGALANLGTVFAEFADRDGVPPAPTRAQSLEAASDHLHTALDGCEQMYGEEDHRTGGLLRSLAEVCDARGEVEDGRRYRERAEANRGANFAGDADAAELSARGTSLRSYGLYDEALAYLERALSIREEAVGEQDFDTSTSLLKLGVLFQLRGRDAEARSYLERALSVRKEGGGEQHPATELVRQNLMLLDA